MINTLALSRKTTETMMNKMMRAARMHEVGKPMEIELIPVPEVRPTDVLVNVKACGIVPNLGNGLMRTVRLRHACGGDRAQISHDIGNLFVAQFITPWRHVG
jgi:hypothetical protein